MIALEAGISGGSLTLFRGRTVIDWRRGDEIFGRSDFLAEKISIFLDENLVEKKEIKKIVYSVTPGSHTSLKNGAAICRGLSVGLGAVWQERDLFECICEKTPQKESVNKLIVLPVSKTESEFRIYGKGIRRGISCLIRADEFEKIPDFSIKKSFEIYAPLEILAGSNPFLKDKLISDESIVFNDLGVNLSVYLYGKI